MNNAAFETTVENIRKHRCITLVTTETRSNYLVLEPNCHAANFLTENLLAIELKRT